VGNVPLQCPRCDHPITAEAVSADVCARCGATLAALPEIDISKLVLLDERDARPPTIGDGGPTSPARFAPADAFAPPGAFAPPMVGPAPAGHASPDPDADDDAALGVERSTRAIRIENQWQHEKDARQAAARVPPPRPRRRIGGLVAAIVAIAAVVAAVVVIIGYQRIPAPVHPGSEVSSRGVSIRITSRPPAEVTIDGQRAGKTPLTLQRPRSRVPIQITGPHGTRQIIPDRDQVVDLSAR
jgi:hypothetical protein